MSTARATSKSTAVERRNRLIVLVKSLPEARAIPAGDHHLSFEVRGKRFGWFLEDHHGDGRLALNLKAPRGANQALAARDTDRFHVPKYVGHHGWVGVWLDSPAPDWKEIEKLIEDAYRLTAPKRPVKVLRTTNNHVKP
jgi:predicted DNA-binding protein (MmcQ/YjbR family)